MGIENISEKEKVLRVAAQVKTKRKVRKVRTPALKVGGEASDTFTVETLSKYKTRSETANLRKTLRKVIESNIKQEQ